MNPSQTPAVLVGALTRHLADRPRIAATPRSHGAAVTGGARGHRWEIDIVVGLGELVISVTGESPECRRALRNALIGKATLLADLSERHVLARMEIRRNPRRREVLEGAALAARWARWLNRAVRSTPIGDEKAPALTRDETAVYWWDERANFGDAIGPWLVQRISGAQPVNARRRRRVKPALYAVGSIIGYVDRNNVDVWGAGLMAPLEGETLERLRKRSDVRVHAVRGECTRLELMRELGWDVPEVYGDPGLLLPRFYTPTPASVPAGVAVVPHYVHKRYFPDEGPPCVDIVDVAENLERVIDRIAGAQACVATSLHGAIIAQAYGVPWLWLRVEDHPLAGDTFKFADFFSTLDSRVASRDVASADIAALDLAAMGAAATLPELQISLDALHEAFPVPVGPQAGQPFEPPLLPRRRPRLVTAARSLGTRTPAVPAKSSAADPAPAGARVSSADIDTLVSAVRETTASVKAMHAELKKQRKMIDSLRLSASAETMTEVQEFVNTRQLTMLETLRRLATTDCSLARFGDGEFRLMLRPDFDLAFQRNSPELQRELLDVFRSADEPGLEIGFPQVFRDPHWTGVWSELWPQLRLRTPERGTFLNSHVTRPAAFIFLRDDAVTLWQKVWAGKRVALIAGSGSRADVDSTLYSSAASVTLIESKATHAYSDIDRVVDVVTSGDAYDVALIALGPAATVLARRLHRAGIRALDVGHLSASYDHVYAGRQRPEDNPISRTS
ncbi:GT-D fold domain-containing glycosyltransferase [Nocardioides sp. DS6]|uniref:GT-D fold domain-containing glycosyltransferase n=1 Tax=Nocardioides eburneus TaxID=3231482 RepID=A0ABV3STJ2_9ACTN